MTTRHLPLTRLPAGGVAEAALVCGDPERATLAAGFLDEASLISEQREYRAYAGRFQDLPVTICSHGVGAPGAAIAFEELIAAGARRIVRAGTCGGLQPSVQAGNLVIATAAVQNTGYGRETAPAGYPAAADPALTLALQAAAAALQQEMQSGIVLTTDNFYAGPGGPDTANYELMSRANVLAVEMECAALFLVGTLRGVRTAAVLAVDGNVLASGEQMDQYAPQIGVVQAAIKQTILIGLHALRQDNG